jgi:uncharacterized membrane protein YqjE
MIGVSSAQKNTNGNSDQAWSAVTSIPLSEEGTGSGGEQSLGNLVRDATTHISTLVRAELELAKTEVTGEVKKGLKGSVFFVLALAVLVFSLFFGFFTLAEGLHALGLWRWASFGIVFLLMLVVAGLFALLGWRRVRKIRKPQRTIDSLRDTAQVARRHGNEERSAG